jgi:riboflavin kinase
MGFTPFPGTLNIRTDDTKVRSFLMDMEPVMVEGFNDGKRSFGWVKLYKVKINGVGGAIIRPERTRHSPDIVELITDTDLRKKKGLDKGKTVELQKN